MFVIIGFLNCAHLMIMTISIVLKVMFLLSNMYDVKRGGGGGVKVNVTMTLRIMILICEQPLNVTKLLWSQLVWINKVALYN